MRRTSAVIALLLVGAAATLVSQPPGDGVSSELTARLKNAARSPKLNGWIQVRLAGSPAEIGFQHGYLLAREIDETIRVVSLELARTQEKKWETYRTAARDVFWPHVEQEYRDELNGIAEGLKAKDINRDLWDVVALNAWLELPYYDKALGEKASPGVAERCSAFVATGSYTRDGGIVIGHNAWTTYATGVLWNVIFDISPAAGNRFLMDGMPGLIHSGDDFGVNSSGIVITETTITGFKGFDPDAVPEFVRARKAMQYANSIDDFARIMKEGNNGGYANTWLVADRKTNEIASLELGLKNAILERTRDGYFAGSNFPANPRLIADETNFDPSDRGSSPNARRARWIQLMEQYKGKIDMAAGQRFMADHVDSFTGKTDASERTLCGHGELSPRGIGDWQPPYGPAGAAQNKVTDSAGAAAMSFTAAFGHACGRDFKAAAHLKKYPKFSRDSDILRDLDAQPWTMFTAKR